MLKEKRKRIIRICLKRKREKALAVVLGEMFMVMSFGSASYVI